MRISARSLAPMLVLTAALATFGPAGSSFAGEEPAKALRVGERVPDLELTLLDGTTRKVSELAGPKATLFYFMATW